MEVKNSFTREQLEANDLALKNLVEFVQSGDAILMAGAGCSGDLYPPWGAFIDRLEKEAQIVDPSFQGNKEDFLVFADKVKECLKDERYYSLIYDIFKPGNDTHLPFHESLCRLPFKAITTTNYDLVLEHALTVVTGKPNNSLHFEGTTKNKIHEFLQSLNFNRSFNKKLIVHLHGIYDTAASIVLSGKEYSSKYGFEIGNNEDTLFDQLQGGNLSRERLNTLLIKYGYEWPLRRKLLWSLLATRRIVFIGFSMKDPYFMKMLDFVQDDLSTYYTEAHFLILRVTPQSLKQSIDQANHMKSEYGIQTVFFHDDDESYTGLGQFIAELENRVNQAPEGEFINKAVAIKEKAVIQGDAELTNQLFVLSQNQYADED